MSVAKQNKKKKKKKKSAIQNLMVQSLKSRTSSHPVKFKESTPPAIISKEVEKRLKCKREGMFCFIDENTD